MKMTDIMPLEKWIELQEELHAKFHLNADIMDEEGKRLAGNTWGNDLCREIRGDAKGFGAICAPAGQAFGQLLKKSTGPFSEECDAGMMRVSVPIIRDGQFIGAVGGCGLMPAEGEIDEFMIDVSSDLTAENIATMATKVSAVSEAQVKEIQDFITAKIDAIGK